MLRNRLIAYTLLATALGTATAMDTPLWLRNPSLSPDGTTLAFTYKGDIWLVPVSGGQARQLTTNPAYETKPIWSKDGKSIAFQSTRTDNKNDIYIISPLGGTAIRITRGSGTEALRAWLNDSTLLFSASELGSTSALLPPRVQPIFSVNINNPQRPRLYAHVALGSADADS